jgi:hypothetical protein
VREKSRDLLRTFCKMPDYIIRVRLFINHENLAIFSDISRRKTSISLSNVRIIYKIRLYIKCVSDLSVSVVCYLSSVPIAQVRINFTVFTLLYKYFLLTTPLSG